MNPINALQRGQYVGSMTDKDHLKIGPLKSYDPKNHQIELLKSVLYFLGTEYLEATLYPGIDKTCDDTIKMPDSNILYGEELIKKLGERVFPGTYMLPKGIILRSWRPDGKETLKEIIRELEKDKKRYKSALEKEGLTLFGKIKNYFK